MKKIPFTSVSRWTGLLWLMFIGSLPTWLNAQPTGTAIQLYTNTDDGSAKFAVDEFGSFRGCGGNGLIFDPLGPFGPKQSDCFSTIYLFDQAGTRRVVLSDNDWPYYFDCLPTGTEVAATAAANVTTDITVGTHTRITQFNLPQFPELQVQLTQVACGNKLVQEYAVTNTSTVQVDLRFARTGDLDIEFTNNFTRNYAGEYPLGSASPIGGIVLDESTNFGVAFTSVPSADAVFEGWRVQVGGSGSFVHSATWGNYGYAPIAYPGVNGDGLNGMWSNPGPINSNGICGVSSTDVPQAPDFATYHATLPPRDMGLVVQSKLSVPAGQTRTYITEVIAEPGANCCQGPNCGIISGNVAKDNGGCTMGIVIANQIVVATETSTQLKYYALTDAGGNYMINAPFGNYGVTLDVASNVACGTALPDYDLNALIPAVTGVNILASGTCQADIFITGSYPTSTPIPSFCGLPPLTPCPGFPFEYCFTVLNNGTTPINMGSDFLISLPSTFVVNSFSPTAPNACWSSYAGNLAVLADTLLPNSLCSFCVNVSIPASDTPPWTTFVFSGANAYCIDSNAVLDFETLTDTTACSCDPNHKSAYPIGCGPNHVIGLEDITYDITFDNIGASPANRVVVIDQLDEDLDIGTFRILQTSHLLSDARIHPVVGNPGQYEVHFIFDNINLAPIALDPNAVGRIIYRIAPKSGLTDGTLLENYATIYFDANPPIQTNTVTHTFRAQPSPIINLGPDVTLYQGYGPTCITLNPNVTGGSAPFIYAWSTGATTSTLQACPGTTTAYTVTVTDAEGCADVGTITVNVVDVRCGNNMNKVIICHNGHEICVSPNAVQTHLDHGDILGPCPAAKADAVPAPSPAMQLSMELFPNPAGITTQVRFELPADGDARLVLYAMDGRQIAEVWKGFVVGGRLQAMEMDLRSLEAGIYALRLESGIGQLTKRLVVAR